MKKEIQINKVNSHYCNKCDDNVYANSTGSYPAILRCKDCDQFLGTGYPEPDQKDFEFIEKALELRYQHDTPLVGDLLIMLDGTRQRVAYLWDNNNALQPSDGGSFHLLDNGSASMSGGLNSRVPNDFTFTEKYVRAQFWIFHHQQMNGHNGVEFSVPVKLWRQNNV